MVVRVWLPKPIRYSLAGSPFDLSTLGPDIEQVEHDADVGLVSNRVDLPGDAPIPAQVLVWTHEPSYDQGTEPEVIPHPLTPYTLHRLNCYTGGVYCDPYAYFPHHQGPIEARQWTAEAWAVRPSVPPMVALQTFTVHGTWNRVPQSLRPLRNAIAVEAHRRGLCDLYGDGAPQPRRSKPRDWHADKLQVLRQGQYRFNLCFESVRVENCVTEKFWDAICAGCLPVYYGARWLDVDFPRDTASYLDYRDHPSPEALCERVATMSREEWNTRMRACVDYFNHLQHRLRQEGHNSQVHIRASLRRKLREMAGKK